MKKANVLSLFLSLIVAFSLFPAASAAGFNDVTADDWFSGAVDYVVSNNLMGGYNATTFGPNDNLSRAMVVQVLYNKEGKPAISGKHDFTDVTADQWFNSAVTWGTQKGVMGGYGDGKFGPNDNVTLEQIAVILWNYSGKPAFSAKADSMGTHSNWAANGLGWAVEKGLLNNVPYKAVTDGATRAQTAQILTNYLSGSNANPSGSSVTGITLDITSHKMGETWTQYLTATLSPAGAKDTITWSSSNPKVATVDQKGKVTGVSGGEATITAKTSNGKTATCTVEVWHDHKLTSSKPVTCTDGGLDVYTCSGCGHSYESWTPAPGNPHTWKAATCDTPKTCTTCGTTSGNPSAHKWVAATCTTAKTCSVCKTTDGSPLGHVANNNGKCTRCGKDATIDMELRVGKPITSGLGFCYYKNSVDGIKLCWQAPNLSGKTINYYDITLYFYNSVGDPAYDEITGKNYKTKKYVGPVSPDANLLIFSDIGYVPACSKIVVGDITLKYSDGTTETGWYGYYTTTKSPIKL